MSTHTRLFDVHVNCVHGCEQLLSVVARRERIACVCVAASMHAHDTLPPHSASSCSDIHSRVRTLHRCICSACMRERSCAAMCTINAGNKYYTAHTVPLLLPLQLYAAPLAAAMLLT
jgi:hypothetical protein